MSATAAFDRSADRDALQQQMDEFARNGGMIEKLDYAGNLVGLEADQPKAARPIAKALPKPAPKKAPVEGFIELDDRPVVHLTPVEVIPEPEVKLRAKVLPFPASKARAKTPPMETTAEWCDRVCGQMAPAPTAEAPASLALVPKKPALAPADITTALRTLRADAERALAHLNAVFPGCGK